MLRCIIEFIEQVGNKCEALPIFPNDFNKFDNIRGQIQYTIYQMTLKIAFNMLYSHQNIKISPSENDVTFL